MAAKRCPKCGRFTRAVHGIFRLRNRSKGRSRKVDRVLGHECRACLRWEPV